MLFYGTDGLYTVLTEMQGKAEYFKNSPNSGDVI